MNLTITPGQLGVRPPVTKPHPDFLKHFGEEQFRKLISDHYDSLITSDIRSLFPLNEEDLIAAKAHASDFFIQISGGPAYFNQHRGQPQMVGRHAPFRITLEARNTWLSLYIPLLENLKTKDGQPMPEELTMSLWNYLDIFSIWMMNTQS